MLVHVNITISGKVQKIGFRFSAMQYAAENHITGFVKNLENGLVYIEAEGTQEYIDNYIEWCKTGPPWAVVKEISVETGEVKNFTSFDIIG